MTPLEENYRKVLARVNEAAARFGRAGQVRLLAVSKTFPAADIRTLFNAGQTCFGENRVQELQTKASALPEAVEWHLIGHLQSNKAVKAVALAAWIHAVDSVHLAEKLGHAAASAGRTITVLLEANLSGEKSKFGLRTFGEAARVAATVLAHADHLRLAGLMTMAEFGASETRLRETFAGLRVMRDRLETEFRCVLPELSMGMTADFEAAIREGSTIVRIGTAIFGGRAPAKPPG